jgi:hypothetical protein
LSPQPQRTKSIFHINYIDVKALKLIIDRARVIYLIQTFRDFSFYYIILISIKFGTVIKLSEFQKFAKHCLTESESMEVVNYIAANPTEGGITKGTGRTRTLTRVLCKRLNSG